MYRRILVPIDGSDTAQAGLDEAIALARRDRAELRVLFVLDDLAHVTGYVSYAAYRAYITPHLQAMASAILNRAVEQGVRAHVPIDARCVDAVGCRVWPAVIDEARDWKADLIVVGSHGRRGVDRALLGSDAEQIVRHASVPVLVVHGRDGDASRVAREPARSTASWVDALAQDVARSWAT